MREFRGAMPRISRASVNFFRFLQKNYCILKHYSKSKMKALHLQIFRLSVIVFRFLQKNYCTLKLQSNSRSTKKNLRIAGWTNYLREILTERGGIPNGRSLALLARGSKMKALHLHNLRPCVNVVCFLKKNIAYWNFLTEADFLRKKNLIVADWERNLRDSSK